MRECGVGVERTILEKERQSERGRELRQGRAGLKPTLINN
jgi:hypothetical protein